MHRFFGFFKRRDDMNFMVKKLGHSFIKKKKIHLVILLLDFSYITLFILKHIKLIFTN